ncbi:MAG TPA: RNA polymerase sigma factor [Terriglobales bacterium]|nr:RNA polymerase sigma factor [Terriglobales bacterium]
MINVAPTTVRSRQDREVIDRFFDSPSEQSFEELFHAFAPQVVAFFRSRRCEFSLAEDLAQEVMLTVYRKARQLRDRRSFRGWLFKIALNVLRVYYGTNKAHKLETVDLATVADRLATKQNHESAGTPGFEFLEWMAFLDSCESEVMKLRFIEQWEYHEIAAARAIPIGTVQWRVFNSKKKLAPYLTAKAA